MYILTLLTLLTPILSLPTPPPTNGLFDLLTTYTPPTSTSPISPIWLPNFSEGILPIPCHSHNDYLQKIPLYQALAVGCASVEADIWVRGGELLVGHERGGLSGDRTLRSLYLDPLRGILEGQNQNQNQNQNLAQNRKWKRNSSSIADPTTGIPKGVFDAEPQTSLVLLVDFKSSAASTWPLFMSQLEEFRERGWLTYWKPETGIVQRPLTIVATGASSLNDIIANSSYRDVFFDAPLSDLSKPNIQYDTTNSYYASVQLGKSVGKVGQRFSEAQNGVIEKQAKRAGELGLRSRYWDAPGVPQVVRRRVWEELVVLGVSLLNVDDLVDVRDWFDSRS